jgi:hypothetical protein
VFHITTDGQPASLSWNKAPSGAYGQNFISQTVADLLMWGALSDERTGLSFTRAAGPRQRSHSRVRVPLDSWPYFTVSDSRFPFSSPPTTRRVTVEVFDPASTREIWPCYFKTIYILLQQFLSYFSSLTILVMSIFFILMEVTMKNTVVWNMTPCKLVDLYWRIGETCCLSFILKMEVARSS